MSRTAEAARGKWKGILLSMGVDRKMLEGKHCACPLCGGKDRFRFDDKEGRGTWICSVCGAGNGFDLLQKVKGWDFKTAAVEVDKIVGSVPVHMPKPALADDDRVAMLRRLWVGSIPIMDGDAVCRYLIGRGLPLPQNRACLRYADRCPVPGGTSRPAMIAMVTGPDGKPATLHRTFLGEHGKADMDDPRATMPGSIPDGSAIRLSMHGERLGIAEGIETALAASARFGLPVWAAINATMLAKWTPPEGVREVVIFGDNDDSFTGHAASYALARRLRMKLKIAVDVRIPAKAGKDWADADAA